TLKMLGETEKSLTAYQCGLKYSANDIPSLNEIGLLFTELKKFDEAEAAFLKAFSLNENNASTCINVSHLYVEKKEVRKAIDFANKALTLEPYRSEPYCNIGTAFIIGNQIPEGIEYLKLSLSLTNKSTKTALTHQSILMNMLYADCYSPEEIFLEHKNWANTHLIQKSTFDNKAGLTFNKHKILNIGFVSSDFNDHSIAQFLTPVMENINQDKFKIHCYSTTEKIDQITKIYKQFATKWHDIANIDEHEIDNIIRQDKIDILIDLSGHSLGSNISIFANKPAPIQITYLGYPFSSGLKNMDYRITDYFTDPENITEHLHSEKLARISPSFLCYKPKAAPIINKTLPRERNSYLTFGSFNNFYKLSNDTISAWAKILINTPQSVIFLKSTLPIPDGLKDTILSRFEENGIHFSRIKMHHATIKKTEHLDMYNNIDICLDPFPYNGTTTTYEAISMGVPVVALSGDCHHSRVSSGILNNLGLTELTAESTETYISLATNLAKNTDKLKHYRKNL
ncbi:MAG TPA: hypothetical protein ENK06_13475, partial [Gammaproteobacteria bacterium]|nr:hypothetical protein [Gammaproteobacteria bacterium]